MVSIPKHRYSWNDIERMCVSIVNQMYKDNWKPDYIVGITRGGNVPATIISNMTGIKCEAVKISLRDDDTPPQSVWNIGSGNILIVDDINDTGATFNWIIHDWKKKTCAHVFGNSVRFAVLTDNLASEAIRPVDYSCHEINKDENDVWLIYPWEDVGAYNGLPR
jgi:hypoxanthine phosphoribosyltransferase